MTRPFDVPQMRYNRIMKSATIPSVRVDPAFRSEIEQVLGEDETLSEFVESAVRVSVRQRRDQAEFLARGRRSLADAKKSGIYIDANVVMDRLKAKLAAAKPEVQTARR